MGLLAPALAAKDTWLRVSAPEFTLITSLPQRDAIAWAGEFSHYVAAMRSFFRNGDRELAPLTVVIFARERDFEQYRPLGADGRPQLMAGFFSRQPSWAIAGLASLNSPEDVRRTIFHEGVHWFLSQNDRVNPVWLDEGLAEVFSTFRATKTDAEWGRAIDEHVALLRLNDTVSLKDALFAAHGDLFGNDSLRTSFVYAKSWEFAHFVIFGEHDIPRDALGKYAQLLSQAMEPDEAFTRAFGKTYDQMDKLLEGYLRRGRYHIARQPLTNVAPPKTDPAPPCEVEFALSRLALVAHRKSLAIDHARSAIALADTDPRGHEALGFALKDDGDIAGALAEFTRAKACGSRDSTTYFELAVAAQNDGADPGGRINLAPAEARTIANNYERAINLHPQFREAYQNLAGVIGVAEPWGDTDRQFFDLGHQLYPRDAMIRIGRLVLMDRAGDHTAARAELDQLLAKEDELPASARNFARRLDDAWEQQAVASRIDELSAAKNFREAIAYIDERLEHGVGSSLRGQLARMREEFQVAIKTQLVQDAIAEQRWADARRICIELLSSKAAPPIRQQARRTLDELDRRKLGLEKERADGH
jgi:tetratricopeptide (TPR) repeat protein